MKSLIPLEECAESESELVGTKAMNLGRLPRAGYRVPRGFCLPPDGTEEEALRATDVLGELVSVRSSAPAEDLEGRSFARQYKTFLGVRRDDLLDAVRRCRAPAWSPQLRAYGASPAPIPVIIQEMIEAEVSGVIFTLDPLEHSTVLVESAFGLGEGIVSGLVQPDRFRLSRKGEVLERFISEKRFAVTSTGKLELSIEKANCPSLLDSELTELARIALGIEELFGSPQDIEWAIAGGEIFILQARPVTATAQKTQQVIRSEIERIKNIAPEPTVWSNYNLSEVLPRPTPMSWSYARKVLSAKGALGRCLRRLGFFPERRFREASIVELLFARPYVNLRIEPRLYAGAFPFVHNYEKLKANPALASYPNPDVDIREAPWWFWLLLPYYTVRLIHAGLKLSLKRTSYDYESVHRSFLAYIQEQSEIDLSSLPLQKVIQKLGEWEEQILNKYVPLCLLPTIFAGESLRALERALRKHFGERSGSIARSLSITGNNKTLQLNQYLWLLGRGEIDRSEFISRFGHRCIEELELSKPRWSELDTELTSHARRVARAPEPSLSSRKALCTRDNLEERLREELPPRVLRVVLKEAEFARRYMSERENANDDLIRAYQLFRLALLQLGEKTSLRSDIFYLERDELPELLAGKDFSRTIRLRKSRRKILLSVDIPDVIFSEEIERILSGGEVLSEETLQGLSVSWGRANGRAWVTTDPTEEPPFRSYVLVAPSTDPAWTALFPDAVALALERGGALSHGAIVAREYGIPTLTLLPGLLRQVKTGDRLIIDADSGKLHILSRPS